MIASKKGFLVFDCFNLDKIQIDCRKLSKLSHSSVDLHSKEMDEYVKESDEENPTGCASISHKTFMHKSRQLPLQPIELIALETVVSYKIDIMALHTDRLL